MSSRVATSTPKSTPVRQTPQATPATESPGNWQHPRLKEINRRQAKALFNQDNVRTITYNAVALLLLLAVRSWVFPIVPEFLVKAVRPVIRYYLGWAYASLALVPLTNISVACWPLFRPKDDFSDIPLTPAQRRVLGLPPSNKTTPASAISTPPRYKRTPSRSGSPAASHTSSPLSNRASTSSDRRLGGSPYSPVTASPLLQKAVSGAANGNRGSWFGSPSVLGASTASSFFGDGPSTPSPSTGKRATVGLTNKWLYEKGGRSSGNPLQQQLRQFQESL